MAYNRKMRKFEGTCYIPGEQLAMMAKYYRGANLNLNLTLFEDDLSTLQETLDQACWCSKLDEVDRMKMTHMKGNEWRIAHEHCLEQDPDGKNPKVYPALPQHSRSTVVKVERGTSAVSLYDRERGIVRGGRYQRDEYSEPRNRRDDYCDGRTRRSEYNERNSRGYYSDPRIVRDDRDLRYARDDNPAPTTYHAQVLQNDKRGGRHMGGPLDQRYDMESEPAMSSMPEAHGDIRCAVCNVETCLVCKNHLYGPICQCKCPVANAGLCNRCNQEPCEEEEPAVHETRGSKMDLSSMMFTMMMSSMFKQSQAQESVCCCKPSKDNSYGSSSDSSDEKVHKVYLYDCEETNRSKKSKKKPKRASSESSSACDCCKCSHKPKKNSGKKEKSSKSSDDEISAGDTGQKRRSSNKKDSKDSNRRSKEGDSNTESKGSKGSNRKSTIDEHSSSKNSKEEDVRSIKYENMKSLKMKDRNESPMKQGNGKTQGFKVQGRDDSKNVTFSNAKNASLLKSHKLSSSESDEPKQFPSSRKSPQALASELLDTQHNVPDLEPSNSTKKDEDEVLEAGEESSTTFSLREFIVCLPKIQSNLQSLMHKLNQMDNLNNQLQCPRFGTQINAQFPCGGMPTRPDVPLISSHQNPYNTPGSLCNDSNPGKYTHNQMPDSEISIGFSPGSPAAQNMPEPISKVEPREHTPVNPPTKYGSIINSSTLCEKPNSNNTTGGWKHRGGEVTDTVDRTKSAFKFSPLGVGALTNCNIRKHENWGTYKEGDSIAHSSLPLVLPNIDHNEPKQNVEGALISSDNAYGKTIPGPLSGGIFQCPKPYGGNKNKVQQKYNSFPDPSNSLHNLEIIELPGIDSQTGNGIQKGGTTATPSSHYGGETIYRSYNKESSAETSQQNLTDYASFTDEKHFQSSPASSLQHINNNMRIKTDGKREIVDKNHGKPKVPQKPDGRGIISKCSRSNRHMRALRKARSVMKASKRVSFKAKQRSTFPLEKLVRPTFPQNGRGPPNKRNSKVSIERKTKPIEKNKLTLFDQGVGPGIFRRSKSDSSLDPSNASNQYLPSSARPKTPKKLIEKYRTQRVISDQKHNEVIPLKNNKPASPIKEKERYTEATQINRPLPKTMESCVLGEMDFKTISLDQRADQSDSMFKMSDAYVRQEVDSYVVSSFEVKTINNGSSTDILKMVQGITSNSIMNMNVTEASSVPLKTAPTSSDDFYNILPLIPLSSTATACESDARDEKPSGGAVVVKKQVSFENEASPNAPAFLRKSRVQVEQLKRAHETIRSMIKNVNEVIAHIDSDSKIGIKSKDRSEEKERMSYFVHLGDDQSKKQSHHSSPGTKNDVMQLRGSESTSKPTCHIDEQREVQKMFSSVNRVLNAVLTPSDQSNVTPEDHHWPSENATPSRTRRDYFILNSDSSSTAFTESLRRSLENDTSRSVPLATQQIMPSPQRSNSHRPGSTRPLKRRSWFPTPKK